MELSQSSIQALVKKIKEEMFVDIDPYSFVSPSAYDTAWLAMIPDSHHQFRPMFKDCLDWVLNNQREEGCWGEFDDHGMPTIESLPATLACIIALKRWNVGRTKVEKGLSFIQANAEELIGAPYDCYPRWFTIVFPAMVELAHSIGLKINFSDRLKVAVIDIFYERERILETEELVDMHHDPPLLSYLEALPSSFYIYQEDIVEHLSGDGSLYQSPAATAQAFMATGNNGCLAYLQSLCQRCANGVPQTYPVDEDLIKLCIVNQLQSLGLAEHFTQEIEEVLAQVYRNYLNQESHVKPINLLAAQLYKDSLAFRLLRMHGYSVSPWSFCWFLHHDEELRARIENNHEYFSSVMLNVYKATDLMFHGEYELQEARSFSRKLLEKAISIGTRDQHQVTFPNFQRAIEIELSLPWIGRMDHLEHRMWIEEKNMNALWMGKSSFHRLSSLHNDKLRQLAVQNYEFRQSIYKYELEELKRWTKGWGLNDMGFGREKTTYCYFAVAATTSLPYDSDIRMIVAKSAILITVADDFYDMEGSLNDLNSLTDAVRRWDAKGLSGHSKTIFDALDNFVREIAAKHLHQQGSDILDYLQDIWYETFVSWLKEAEWSKTGFLPSMDEYLQTGMTSIATHTIVLPASCFLNPSLPKNKLRPGQYETITKLLMAIPRLLNDIQSYQKELEEGKINFVLLYLRENPDANIEDSIAYVKDILDKKKSEFLKHALMDGFSDLPKPCKHLHLLCLKVFEMFFNSSNRYDSNTEMLHDIQKAIYIPLEVETSKPLQHPLLHSGPKKKDKTIKSHLSRPSKICIKRSVIAHHVSLPILRGGHTNMFVPPKFSLRFV